MAEYEDKIFDHDIDGIKEYDNPLPGWLMAILWGSLIFSVLYIAFYALAFGEPTMDSEYRSEATDDLAATTQERPGHPAAGRAMRCWLLPPLGAGAALVRSSDAARRPIAVEPARQRCDSLAVHGAGVHPLRIAGDCSSHCLVDRRRVGVPPERVRHLGAVGKGQAGVAGGPLELTHRAQQGGSQQIGADVVAGKVAADAVVTSDAAPGPSQSPAKAIQPRLPPGPKQNI